ncbi:MAG: glycosyltransferase, partial [Nitrospiraceae bacterium]|nr:glycosyltransferase [Nitrospiraceae bacterium]
MNKNPVGDRAAVVIVSPPGYPHSMVFRQIAENVFYGLRALGYEATLGVNNFLPDGLNIIFGSHLLTPEQAAGLPEKSIIYNLEQADPSSMWAAVRPLLGCFPVWDYSVRNIEKCVALGYREAVFHVPIGYRPELTRIKPARAQDIDVIFHGSMNERRKKVLEALEREGLRVVHIFGVYGAAFDAYIARAKVDLNIHFYESKIFEMDRVSYLLSNRKAVVSEFDENTDIEPGLEGAFVRAPYGRLVSECKALVDDEERRAALEKAAFDIFSKRDEAGYLRAGLAWAESFRSGNGKSERGKSVEKNAFPTDYPRCLNMGSGRDFKPDCLNLDYNDYWKPDIVCDLNEPFPFGKTLSTERFGEFTIEKGSFDKIIACHLIEHIRELAVFMTSCLKLLREGGEMDIRVPYDLSYGAWQDPTHLHAFNERSWLYYTDWFWYLGWTDARFDLASMNFGLSDYGKTLKGKMPDEALLRQPRAIDEMRVILRKRALTEEERQLAEKESAGRKPHGPDEGQQETPRAWVESGGNGKSRAETVTGPSINIEPLEKVKKAGPDGCEPGRKEKLPPANPPNPCAPPSGVKGDGGKDAEGEPAAKKDHVPGLVSIVLMVPERLKDIQKGLRLIEEHSRRPHEIIFAGCAGGARARWLRKQADANPAYKFIEMESAGISGGGFAAFANQAIKTASGEYILLMEGGAAVAEGWLAGMMECMEDIEGSGDEAMTAPPVIGPVANRAEGLQGAVSPSGGEAGDGEDEKIGIEVWREQARLLRQKNAHCRVPVQKLDDFCLLFPRALFEKTGGFDETFGSRHYAAWDFMQRSVLAGARCFIAAGALLYREGPDEGEKRDGGKGGEDPDKAAFDKKWGRLDPLGPEARKMRAIKLFDAATHAGQKGDLQTAVAIFIEAVKNSPLADAPFVKGLYYRFARMLIENGQFRHALDVLSNMPESAGPDAVALEIRGYCSDGLGEEQEAERLVGEALDLRRGPGALDLTGLIHFKKGALAEAASFFEEAIKADGGYAEAYTNLGAIRWAEGKKQEAFDLFEKAFVLSPQADDIINNYYSAVAELSKSDDGVFGRAVPVVKQAAAFYPSMRRLRHILAEFYVRSGRSREALETLEEAFLTFGVDDASLAVALRIRDVVGPKEIVEEDAGKKEKAKKLSMCMIVKNEAGNLVRSLLNLRPLSDEMIVVDTGSSDRTRDIARALGAKVFDFAWTGDFSAARNFSISKASGGWILVMDADEAVSASSRKALRSLLRGPENTAYHIITRNYTLSPGVWGWRENDGVYPEQAGTGWIPSAKVRLFPNDGRIRFRNPVHELVEDSIREAGMNIAPCETPVHHYGKLFPDKVVAKGRDYFEIGKAKLAAKGGNDLKAAVELAVQAGDR